MIAADIPAQLSVSCDWDHCFREARAELRVDERDALRRVIAGTATVADAALLARALGHHDLFPQLVEERPVAPDQDDAE